MYMGLFILRSIFSFFSLGIGKEKRFEPIGCKYCWHKHVALKISLFLWKLLHNALLTDLAISRKGIYLSSKCNCCPNNPNSEHNTHLFLHSEIGSAVWSF